MNLEKILKPNSIYKHVEGNHYYLIYNREIEDTRKWYIMLCDNYNQQRNTLNIDSYYVSLFPQDVDQYEEVFEETSMETQFFVSELKNINFYKETTYQII
jgi:hypothetical protein